MFKKIDPKMNLPKMEEEILNFWEENKIFEKSVEKEAPKGEYVFYDGPPFATGTPHYGHIVASLMKDTVPRFWTMKGYRVERKWGWDCHGLPIENIAEKELGIKKKKEIEEMGVAKFNEFCRSKVLKYVDEWKIVINRLGRWADMENSYKTMDLSFMESVWWVFKQLWDKGLIYEGHRTMHICTRCETTLSQSEVAEGYKDVKDLSVTVKFEITNYENNTKYENTKDEKTYILAWTTTPWTLIGNVALAVGEDIDYVKIICHSELVEESSSENRVDPSTPLRSAQDDNCYILAKNRIADVFKDKKYEIISEFKGKDLVGKAYKPLFDYYKDKGLDNEENGWKIYAGDFVTTVDGTGVVHIAPAFGEDDAKLGQKYKLPFVQHVGFDGAIKSEATDFVGMNVTEMSKDVKKVDIEIIKYLDNKNLLFAKEKYEHSYPHCWRCETPLINYATSSWFVNVEKIKKDLLENAKGINWTPKHIKEGRFGNWLEAARDWSISRQRYWASVMPIWKCDKCEEIKVIGSVKELEDLSGEKISDIHKHIVDKITFPCEKCGSSTSSGQAGTMKRIPDVLDTWFDSGSMPYAQAHYPFDPSSISSQSSDNYGAGNKEKLGSLKGFPAQFIAEGTDQTRCWFYYLHVISGAVKNSKAFENVIVNGIVLAEDGKKMAKRLQNYPDPMDMFGKYGADAVRLYLLSSPVMAADDINFSEKEVAELVRGIFRMLWNSYSFFVLYANIDGFDPKKIVKTRHASSLLDKWIISELNILIKDVNANMENYDLPRATRLFSRFIDNLSNWYIRRSRKRFWKSENDEDKNEAYATLHYVLLTLAKLMAPFTPFISEEIWKNLSTNYEFYETTNNADSVHLQNFPEADEKLIDDKLNGEMQNVRNIISEGLQLRAKAGIKVRQPIASLKVKSQKSKVKSELIEIIKEEMNVKNVIFDDSISENVSIDTEITEELKLEGQAREIIRYIQEMRKEAGFEVDNRIKIGYSGQLPVFQKFGDLIAKETLANSLRFESQKSESPKEEADLEKEFNLGEEKLKIKIKKI